MIFLSFQESIPKAPNLAQSIVFANPTPPRTASSPPDFSESPLASSLSCAVLAHHATCLADTLASELGMLARQKPILITAPWRQVPPGTNGGITFSGTLWSAAGGAAMGIGTVMIDAVSGIKVYPIKTVMYGLLCGLLGSSIDSFLGATLQVTYYDEDKRLVYSRKDQAPSSAKLISGIDFLSNAGVNFVSVMATTALGGMFIGQIIYGTT